MAKQIKFNQKSLEEWYKKSDKFFKVYDHYTPNFQRAIVTGKFYSKFDCLDLSQADMDLVSAIERTKVKLPRDKYPWPVTENHRYGWFEPLVYLDRKDKRFYTPQLITPTTKQEIKIRMDKTMEKPKFTGIPFKV